jgi:hypothetical protein
MSEYVQSEQVKRVDERVAALFEPDTLVTEQYLDTVRRKTYLDPEQALMLAILEDAINCFRDNASARSEEKKKLFHEAKEWLFSEDADWIFSFTSICELLNLDPSYIRRGLKRWNERTQRATQQRLVA